MKQQHEPNTDWQGSPSAESAVELVEEQDAPFARQYQTHHFIRDHIDLHSAMYHQHLVAANQSISCIQPEHINLKLSKLSETSSSRSKIMPISGTGTITVVTKTTTTTTITGLPVVDVVAQQANALTHQHPDIQQASSPNSISSNSSVDDIDDTESVFEDVSSLQNHKSNNSDQSRQKNQVEEEGINKPSSSISVAGPKAASQSNTPTKSTAKSSKRKSNAKNKRTSTSYDAQTTAYLKRAFFNFYSKQCKLTKEQRDLVIDETGLNSRNVTYWFSNHKRRLGTELEIYREAVTEHGISNYDEFVQWRRGRGLPEHITRDEIKRYRTN
ncbi:hypothetical protein [Parasitella parasitica]|uniref:Homeobox domain-containing protein n=1 Tax=Parasitella parasitica TaxID=35722 RepID=A0A0B7MZL7_9FUNG|nr:hypothetical protein [Parasitella parasitica]